MPGLVAFYDIRPGDGVGFFQAPEPTSRHRCRMEMEKKISKRHYKRAMLKMHCKTMLFSSTAREHGCTIHTTRIAHRPCTRAVITGRKYCWCEPSLSQVFRKLLHDEHIYTVYRTYISEFRLSAHTRTVMRVVFGTPCISVCNLHNI